MQAAAWWPRPWPPLPLPSRRHGSYEDELFHPTLSCRDHGAQCREEPASRRGYCVGPQGATSIRRLWKEEVARPLPSFQHFQERCPHPILQMGKLRLGDRGLCPGHMARGRAGQDSDQGLDSRGHGFPLRPLSSPPVLQLSPGTHWKWRVPGPPALLNLILGGGQWLVFSQVLRGLGCTLKSEGHCPRKSRPGVSSAGPRPRSVLPGRPESFPQ